MKSHKDSGIIERDGYGLRYSIEGKGIPTFVIGSAEYYPRTFSDNLRKHLHFAFVDHRGFGIPPKTESNSLIELDVILDDMEYVRNKLNLRDMIVMGHSGHIYMALEYAKKYPKHVSHVVLICHGPDYSLKSQEHAEQYWQRTASPERKAAFEKNLLDLPSKQRNLTPSQQFIKQYVSYGPRIWYDYKFDSSPLWENVEVNMAIFGHVWGTIFQDIDITKGLDNFHKPVFLALGKYDFLVGQSAWDGVIDKFNDIKMHVFEKSGHTPQFEMADVFDQMLMSWLARRGGAEAQSRGEIKITR